MCVFAGSKGGGIPIWTALRQRLLGDLDPIAEPSPALFEGLSLDPSQRRVPGLKFGFLKTMPENDITRRDPSINSSLVSRGTSVSQACTPPLRSCSFRPLHPQPPRLPHLARHPRLPFIFFLSPLPRTLSSSTKTSGSATGGSTATSAASHPCRFSLAQSSAEFSRL